MENDIINYIMQSPDNTNPNVLRGLLENMSRGGGSMFLTDTDGTLDKTYSEIETAFLSGVPIIITRQTNDKGISVTKHLVVGVIDDTDTGAIEPYSVSICNIHGEGFLIYTTATKNGYPSHSTGK